MWTLLDLAKRHHLRIISHQTGAFAASEGYPGDRTRFHLTLLGSDGAGIREFSGQQADELLQAGLSHVALRGSSARMRLRFTDTRGGEYVIVDSEPASQPLPEDPLAGQLEGGPWPEDPLASLFGEE